MLDEADIPPQDLVAEACVLGCILLDPDLLPKLSAVVGPDDFFRPAHANIFKAASFIVEHPAKWGRLDLVTFKNALQSRGSLCKVVDKPTEAEAMDYLENLMNIPGTTNAMYYAKTVRDKSRLRSAIAAATELIGAAKGANGDTDAVLLDASARFEPIFRVQTERGPSPAAEVSKGIEDAIEGRRQSLAMPWPQLTRAARPVDPGTITIMCGDPGSNKSFMLQEAMLFWHEREIPVAMLHLEKNRQYHLTRALAQLGRDSNLKSLDWQAQHPLETREAMKKFHDELEGYGKCIWDNQEDDVTTEWVSSWIRARATDGARIIAVDPVTAASGGREPWQADRKLIRTCEGLAAAKGCTIIMVTHPRIAKGQKPTLETMAGGMAYGRFTDVVLWTAAHDPPKNGNVRTSLGDQNCYYTNHVALFKTRDSTGRGMHVAFNFNRNTLRMEEIGTIQKD